MIPAAQQADSYTVGLREGAGKTAACVLLLACAAMLVLLAHHPVAASHRADPGHLRELVALGRTARLVHGSLICILGALFYGVLNIAAMLGAGRPAVAFGIAVYGFGCACVVGAMLLDGFVTATLAERLIAAGAQNGDAVPMLVAASVQVLTKAGLAASGIGICSLSSARPRAVRLPAWLALPSTLLPAAIASGSVLRPPLLVTLAACQCLWYMGAAFTLWRGAGIKR